MTTILVICAVGALVWYFVFSGKSGGRSAPQSSSETVPTRSASVPRESPAVRKFNANKEWLRARWNAANQKKEAGDSSAFPPWYFDPVTEKQLKRISDDGLELSTRSLTKGQASDIIGLFVDADEDELEVLKFFKVPTAGMSQTVARVEVPKLMADPLKAEAWRLRPADALQRECLRFYGVSIPRGLTHPDADGLISRREVTLTSEESPLPEDWEHYSHILEELSDRETCQDYGLKKPGTAAIRAAVDSLRNEGQSMQSIADDLDLLSEKLIEMKPELERAD